jgi:hypothetical protein
MKPQLGFSLAACAAVLQASRPPTPFPDRLGSHFGLGGRRSTISTLLLPFLAVTGLLLLRRDLHPFFLGGKLPFECRDLVQHCVAFSVEVFLEIVDDHVLLTHPLCNGAQQVRVGLQLVEEVAIIVLRVRVSLVTVMPRDGHT